MALQKSVQLYPAIGVAGQAVTTEQSVYTPFNYLSDGTAKAGSFCFVSSSSTNTGGVAQSFAGLTTTSATAILGFVERVVDGYNDLGTSASLVYKEGLPLKVALQGDYYISATGSATVGQNVLVTKSTGAISFGSSAGEGEVDTGWIVKTPASASGDIIVISNHSAN